jgi:hypothetical protein
VNRKERENMDDAEMLRQKMIQTNSSIFQKKHLDQENCVITGYIMQGYRYDAGVRLTTGNL